MRKLVNRNMMQEIDKITVNEFQIPSMVLMERAALKVFEQTKKLLEQKAENMRLRREEPQVLVVCSMGNNGGDGVAVARMLHIAGFKVDIHLIGSSKNSTNEMQQQLEIAKRLGVPFTLEPSYNKYSIIIDAILGIGLTRDITGEYEDAIREINESGATIVAVDLPSGIDADDGSVKNVAVKADVTVTFGYQKIGLVRHPGREYAGKVYIEEIGFPLEAYDRMMKLHPECMESYTYDKEDLKRMPVRKRHSHKGTFGTVLVVAGSIGMSGACYFSAKAALRTGAGLVKILTVSENLNMIQTSLPEAVVVPYDETIFTDEKLRITCIDTIRLADVVIVGPGLGKSPLSNEILNLTLRHTLAPTIIDADGINLLAEMVTKQLNVDEKIAGSDIQNIEQRLRCLEKLLPENVILTPHLKEFSRLFQLEIAQINKMFIDTGLISSYNKVLHCIIKDSVTTVVSKKGRYFNLSGNDGLATGGSGDVLTGIIGGMIAQGLDGYHAACLGVYLHGLTSEYYSENYYSGSMIASDIVEHLGNVLKIM